MEGKWGEMLNTYFSVLIGIKKDVAGLVCKVRNDVKKNTPKEIAEPDSSQSPVQKRCWLFCF